MLTVDGRLAKPCVLTICNMYSLYILLRWIWLQLEKVRRLNLVYLCAYLIYSNHLNNFLLPFLLCVFSNFFHIFFLIKVIVNFTSVIVTFFISINISLLAATFFAYAIFKNSRSSKMFRIGHDFKFTSKDVGHNTTRKEEKCVQFSKLRRT